MQTLPSTQSDLAEEKINNRPVVHQPLAKLTGLPRDELLQICLSLTLADLVYIYDLVEGGFILTDNHSGRLAGSIDRDPADLHPPGRGIDAFIIRIHPDDQALFSTMITAFQTAGDQDRSEFSFRFQDRDGAWHWLLNRGSVLSCSDEGRPREILGIVEDISAYKRVESMLEQKAADLARSTAELEQFAYIASHDLQEPLRMVVSYVQLLARRYEGKLDTQADEFIRYAVEGAKRIQGQINDLLEYTSIRKASGFKLIDSQQAFDEALTRLAAVIQKRGAVIKCEALPKIPADAPQITRLFENLVDNAIKFNHSIPPIVKISSRRDGKYWRFAVKDNGIGLEPLYAQRVFAIFERLNARADYAGRGIGLALCKKIVEHHNGQIWVDSELGNGATFFFTIPI